MEKKFKIGDIVYLQKLYTKEEWPDDWTSIDFTFGLNEPLEIQYMCPFNKGFSLVIKDHHSLGNYPDNFFDYQPVNPLKTEINKLKDAILNKRITLYKEDRKKFESLCFKLNIPFQLESIRMIDNDLFVENKCDVRFDNGTLKYYSPYSNLNFKDLIEPFKKFKDEIL